MRIVLAVDGPKFSEAAANEVIAQMNADNIEVTLLHVLEPFPVALAEKVGSKETPEFDLARLTLRDAANEYLGQTAEKLRSAGFRCSYLVEEGDPRDVILDYAERWSADIVVVGSRGLKGLTRFVMGSVSEAVIHHAPCSVEIVRMNPANM